jgi:hypothetical protein
VHRLIVFSPGSSPRAHETDLFPRMEHFAETVIAQG